MSSDYDRFLDSIALKAGVTTAEAEPIARAVLTTLAERIAPGEARDLAAQLPPEVSPWLYTTDPAEGFDEEEFLRRVAAREGTSPEVAERHARAVFAALGQAVPAQEIHDLKAELPADYLPLIAEAEGVFLRTMSASEFLERVAERAQLDADGARRATEAVLETLAGRIAGGEVDDLIPLLPVELRAPLKRGRVPTAVSMPVEEFVARVARREGTTPAAAAEHIRAVFATLRDALPESEFFDITSQLPAAYAAIEA